MSEVKNYPVTYWENVQERIALVRVNETTLQGWQAKGREIDGDFEHRHFQTVYPSKERLEEYLRGFERITRDVYLAYQFEHHQLDDFWRERANAIREAQQAPERATFLDSLGDLPQY